jgi:AcrR family transcriptional regulator
MDRFERRKEQSKEGIRRATEELFSRFGADKVSINDIARKAGVSEATVYNNFGSKENLVRDYHGTIVEKIASSFRGIIVMKKSWVDKFQGFLQSWIDIADRYKLEIESTGHSDNSNQGDNESINSVKGEIENSFREFIKEGKEQKNLRSDISDEAIMTYIKFYRQGISNNPDISDRMRKDMKFSRDLLSLFMYGLVKDGKVNSVTKVRN